MLKIFIKLLFFFFIATFNVKAAKVENINVVGNDRISKDTILMFSKIDLDKDIDNDVLNTILKNLYASNFFEIIEKRQGLKIACLEEIALFNKWVTKKKMNSIIKNYPSSGYKEYIKKIIREN